MVETNHDYPDSVLARYIAQLELDPTNTIQIYVHRSYQEYVQIAIIVFHTNDIFMEITK